ncbi:MAG: sulfatase-like hydrolase/transferase, partial [Bacteroidota bacterium]
MLKIRSLSRLLLLLLGAVCFDCSSPSGESQESDIRLPNIVFLVAEDISPALGCYGDVMAITPNIDRLAANGALFNKAYATAPICAPSRSTLMTGLYATSLGTQHLRSETPFSESLKTVPEYLADAGYFTSNRNKSDYNFDHDNRWEHWSGSLAPWRNRTDDRPFYSFINVGPSHEGSVNSARYEENRQQLVDLGLQPTDPATVKVPPYYPDTDATRAVWARYYDVLQLLDRNVGQVMDSLQADGLMDETIVFFFGDHGFGMPRYKRWLYNTGLQVPLIVQFPDQYQELIPVEKGQTTDRIVSFVDFPATVLNLASAEIPATMQGIPFLGEAIPPARTYAYGARDRADDMFEMSRSVTDGRYIYIRHYMPHLPYIQSGHINGDQKAAYRALREARMEGLNNAEQEKMWLPKPAEELYDLEADPEELNNLAMHQGFQDLKVQMHNELNAWMIQSRDLGLLPEAEYMRRSVGSSPYDYASEGNEFKVRDILAAAEKVGLADEREIVDLLESQDSGVRYWAVLALQQADGLTGDALNALTRRLSDPSPSVQIAAAELVLHLTTSEDALNTLAELVQSEEPTVALQAARSIQLIGDKATLGSSLCTSSASVVRASSDAVRCRTSSAAAICTLG